MLESGARSKKDKVNWSHTPLNPNCSLKYYIPKAQLISLITFTCGSFTIARVCICSSAAYWSNPRLMKAEGNSGPTCVSGLSYHLWGLKAVFIALLGHLSFVGFKRFFAGVWLCLVVLTSDLPIWCWHLWLSFLYPWHMGSRVCHWCQDSISCNICSLHLASRQAAKKERCCPNEHAIWYNRGVTSSLPLLKTWKMWIWPAEGDHSPTLLYHIAGLGFPASFWEANCMIYG